MLNFAERTGSGAVMLVWSYPLSIRHSASNKRTHHLAIHSHFTFDQNNTTTQHNTTQHNNKTTPMRPFSTSHAPMHQCTNAPWWHTNWWVPSFCCSSSREAAPTYKLHSTIELYQTDPFNAAYDLFYLLYLLFMLFASFLHTITPPVAYWTSVWAVSAMGNLQLCQPTSGCLSGTIPPCFHWYNFKYLFHPKAADCCPWELGYGGLFWCVFAVLVQSMRREIALFCRYLGQTEKWCWCREKWENGPEKGNLDAPWACHIEVAESSIADDCCVGWCCPGSVLLLQLLQLLHWD